MILYFGKCLEELLKLILADADSRILDNDPYRLGVDLNVTVDSHIAFHRVF